MAKSLDSRIQIASKTVFFWNVRCLSESFFNINRILDITTCSFSVEMMSLVSHIFPRALARFQLCNRQVAAAFFFVDYIFVAAHVQTIYVCMWSRSRHFALRHRGQLRHYQPDSKTAKDAHEAGIELLQADKWLARVSYAARSLEQHCLKRPHELTENGSLESHLFPARHEKTKRSSSWLRNRWFVKLKSVRFRSKTSRTVFIG